MLKGSEVAKEFNVSPETIRQYAESGRIPFVETPGGHRRYVLEDVKHALSLAKTRKLEAVAEAEQEPRLSESVADGRPIKRAPRPLATSAAAIIADARPQQSGPLRIPFVGKPGTSRFIVGQAARA